MRCEQCSRDFSTDEGFAQHMRDKHGVGKPTSHETKEMRREERDRQKDNERKKQNSGKLMKNVVIAAVALVVIAGIAYLFMTVKPTQATTSNLDLSGITPGYIHWHAQIQAFVCGERRLLPEAADATTHIGTSVLHTHDKQTNIESFPGTDGNGILHIEGDILSDPPAYTFKNFMQAVGVAFGNDTIVDKKNGDACSGVPGTMKVFLNDKPFEGFMNYITRDRDVIRIEFN